MEKLRVSDYITAIEPYLSTTLIPAENLAHIQTIASQLSGALTTFFGFECRLGEAESWVDFPICIGTHQRALLTGSRPMVFQDDFFVNSFEQQLQQFATLWCNSQHPLYEQVRSLWLEFDIDGPPPAQHTPSIYLGSKDMITSTIMEEASNYDWITPSIFNLLYGVSIPKSIENQVRNCLQHLPSGTSVFQIGAMLSREPAFVRVCVSGLPPQQIISYLKKIGWPGDGERLQTLIDELATIVDRIDVAFDVGENIGPKIGFECSFEKTHSSPETEPRWHLFLDYLVDKSWCTPQKREALLHYSGFSHEISDQTRWPQPLLSASKILGPNFISLIRRNLHHIKVVYQDGEVLEAKAYPAITHFWLDVHQLNQLSEVDNLLAKFEGI